MAGKLVMCRHGQSDWNLKNLFTGWTDVDLTEQGVEEAVKAAKLFTELGYEFDVAYTSVLKRAIRTLWIILVGGGCSEKCQDGVTHQACHRATITIHGLD